MKTNGLSRWCFSLLAAVFSPVMWADPGGSESLRQLLDAQSTGAMTGVALHRPALLQQFYAGRDFRLLWADGGELSGREPELVQAIRDSAGHGLNPANYHAESLAALAGPADVAPQGVALRDLLATDALLQQVVHRSTGVVSPRQLDTEWELLAPEVDAMQWLAGLLRSGQGVGTALDALWPSAAEYHALVQERARILQGGDQVTTPVADGPIIRPGQAGPRVAQLRQRLLGPLDTAEIYDADLRQAVQAFQRASGLEPDGLVGESTLQALNARQVDWLDRIDANLERWRWLPRTHPETRIRVNIASYTLRAFDAGEPTLQMRIIAGRPARRSPVFSEVLRYMVFNPYWNVPTRIAVQDKLDILRQDPWSMEALGYEVNVAPGSPFQPLHAVDWSQVTRANYRYLLRQRPGPKNALGQVKFMLPNRHAIYLHDTPNRELFAKEERAFSSGCIRLSEPLKLAEWLLRREGRDALLPQPGTVLGQGEPRTIHLKTPVPTYIVYFTAFTGEDGQVIYRRDIYQRDAPLVAALRG